MGRSVGQWNEHPFYVKEWSDAGERPKPVGHEDLNEHWVGAGHLKIGDKIKQADGTTGVVANVVTLGQTREMFNLTVSEAHTFYVGQNGWLVHNATCPTGLKKASSAFGQIFEGGLNGRSIIDIRKTLTDGGFTQSKAKGFGYIFKNGTGKEVRLMQRNGAWEVRVRNSSGNYLDSVGNVADPKASHSIVVGSK